MQNQLFVRVFLLIVLGLPLVMYSSAIADSHSQQGGTLIFGRGGDSIGLESGA